MSRPKVSVIIPVYNVERYLQECVDSVRRQSFSDIEIILVDDGSTDASGRMCDEVSRIDQRVRVVHKQNEGLGRARNTGLDVASGEWVMFVDSDDFIALNTIEYCMGIIDRVKVDELRFLFEFFSDGKKSPGIVPTGSDCHVSEEKWVKMEPLMDSMAELPGPRSFIATSIGSACTALYRREIIESHRLRFESEREYISEDYLFNIEFGANCGGIGYISEKFYFYRSNPLSLTHTLRRDRIEKSAIYCRHLQRVLESYGYPDSMGFAMRSMVGYLRTQNSHIFNSSLSMREKRALFNDALSHPYIAEIASVDIFGKGLFKQKIAFALRKSFFISWMLYKLNSLRKGM